MLIGLYGNCLCFITVCVDPLSRKSHHPLEMLTPGKLKVAILVAPKHGSRSRVLYGRWEHGTGVLCQAILVSDRRSCDRFSDSGHLLVRIHSHRCLSFRSFSYLSPGFQVTNARQRGWWYQRHLKAQFHEQVQTIDYVEYDHHDSGNNSGC